jgi:hypothetical protein
LQFVLPQQVATHTVDSTLHRITARKRKQLAAKTSIDTQQQSKALSLA